MKPLCLVLILVGGCTPAFQAARRASTSSKPLTWSSLPAHWTFSCDFPADLKPTFRQGFEYWSLALGQPIFEEEVCDCVCLSGTSTVMVEPGLGADLRPRALAMTSLRTEAGFISGASVLYFDSYRQASAQAQETAIRHEAGHVLGLGHGDVEPCLMYPVIWPDDDEVKPACPEELRLVAAGP